jgi:hypothetical protein
MSLVGFLTVVSINGCSFAAGRIDTLVPPDATAIDSRRIGNGSQVSYSVVRGYPSSGVLSKGMTKLRQEGWSICRKAGAGEWASYLDSSSGQRERVYQRLTYLTKADLLITIGERYYSHSSPQLQPGGQSQPDDKAQEVVIVEARLGKKELLEVLDSAGAKCDPAIN